MTSGLYGYSLYTGDLDNGLCADLFPRRVQSSIHQLELKIVITFRLLLLLVRLPSQCYKLHLRTPNPELRLPHYGKKVKSRT